MNKEKPNPKELDSYVMNEIISYAVKSVPFDYQHLLQNAFKKLQAPYVGLNFPESHIALLRDAEYNFDRQLTQLLQSGYIKKINDGSNNYILTEKGEKAQNYGTIEQYESKERWSNFIAKSKDVIVVILIPLVTLIFIGIETFRTKEMIIEKPVKIIIENSKDILPKDNTHLDAQQNKTNYDQNLKDSDNFKKPKGKPIKINIPK